MNEFQAIQPSLLLAPYVKQYWFLKMENVSQCSQRLVPLGCMALSFYRGHETYSLQEDKQLLPQSHIYGIKTNYTDILLSGNIDFICIVFQPFSVNAFFKMPISDFNNSCISIDSLNDIELYELEQKLNDSVDNMICVKIIEQFLLRRIYTLNQYENKRMNAVADAIYRGEDDIQQLANVACLGYKQFKRLFTENIGANPKDYLKIIRFQKLHQLMQKHTGLTVSQLAYDCGYYDKSHLIRELKHFSGFTPTQLIDACEPSCSTYYSLFRSAFIDLPTI